MRFRKLHENGETTYAVVFDSGDEILEGLDQIARAEGLRAARITGLGAFSDCTLGYWDVDRRAYDEIPVREQVEVLNLTGDITEDERGGPKLHLHAVLGKRDGQALGGHLLHAHARPTLEVMVVESPARIRRRQDPRSGLPLIDLESFGTTPDEPEEER